MKDIYYFIAIGGVGMSGLAKYLVEEGFEVQGSDIKTNKNIEYLQSKGAKIHIGHSVDNLPKKCIIVVSSVIKDDNPELKFAKENGFEILHRSDLLSKISRGMCGAKKKYFLGFSGTHGKTTTSGLCSYVLEKSGLKPSYVVGGTIPEIGTNAKAGNGDFFVAELDESDGTIVKYSPEISIINNIEKDHVDFYKNGLASLIETFSTYLSTLSDDARVIVNDDNEGTKLLREANKDREFITFGLSDNADYVAKNIKFEFGETTFDIYFKNEFLTSMKTQLFGIHNVYNVLAVFAGLHQANVNVEEVKKHFYTFTGMGRRFQLSAKLGKICVYDDYAHHPSEIKATLSALQTFKERRKVVVFQPHRYSRLQGLWKEFLGAFDTVDRVYVTDVYAASEPPIDGVTSEAFEKDLESKGIPCKYLSGSIADVAKKLAPDLKENDVVIGVGAGTITALGKELLACKNEVKV